MAVTNSRAMTILLGSLLAWNASAQQGGRGSEQSVNPGVNERYLSAELDVAEVASDLESDTREVYLRRHDVVAALGLEPGMTVADVGAGSGFYVSLFAEAVGPTGRVFAVEIAPNWLEFLNEKVNREGLDRVTVVRGTETSVELPDASVDLIFASDTYHHFEYPQSSLASIHRALKPGGAWVVLDYDKIPGVTPPGRMNHLRIDKAQEIETAGFALERHVDLSLVENYLAVFRRP